MKKVISPCFCKVYSRRGNEDVARAFCKIEFDDNRLSITGVIGPLRSGDCCGGAGQCVDAIREGCPCDEWTQEMLDKFCSIWDEWHLLSSPCGDKLQFLYSKNDVEIYTVIVP